jgi:crotonobetainyl-CoA:carnitine CoA-transferase CaiB-like acyl-CoA transferase
VALSGSVQAMAERVFNVVGREDMIDDPRFKDNTSRVEHREEVDAVVGGWIAGQTRAEVLKRFEHADITSAPVYDISDLVNDRHVAERKIFEELPDDELKWVQMHAPVPRFSATPAGYRRPAPNIGEHTRIVLKEFGFRDDRIEALHHADIVGPNPSR